MDKTEELRKRICEMGRTMYERKTIAAGGDSISVQIEKNRFLCTPLDVSWEFLSPEEICLVDEKGRMVEDGDKRHAAYDLPIHLCVYQSRKDVRAVIHAHPVCATSYSTVGVPLGKPILADAIMSFGNVPIAEYATPASRGLCTNIEKYLSFCDAVLLANHGVLTCGVDLKEACRKMEEVEFYAEVLYRSQKMGVPRELDPEEVSKLVGMHKKLGLPGRHPGEMEEDGEE